MSELSAFPHNSKFDDGVHYAQLGMTLRDYFAAQALNGLLSDHMTTQGIFIVAKNDEKSPASVAAKAAYEYADAMMAAR